jgi:phosphate transport system protein
MNLYNDLERMADHATGIGKTVVRSGGEPLLKPLIDLPRMVSTARDMLKHGLGAYLMRDAVAVRVVAVQDDETDHLYHAIFDEPLVSMTRDPGTIPRGAYLL